jgi:plastocyanin
MRRPLLLLVIALATVLGACASAAGPGWTYAPPTEAPPSQPAPSDMPSVAPSSDAPSDAGGGGGGGTVIKEIAQGIQFVNKDLSAPADTPFQIEFDNQDANTPHNIEIKDASGGVVFKGEIFNGIATKVYDIPALPAGTYPFICTVHPNMIGTLTVGG